MTMRMTSEKKRYKPGVGRVVWGILALGFSILTFQSFAQSQRAKKVPGLSKISPPFTRQAFSGVVQSLDLKRKVLTVNSVKDNDIELFPITKHEHVEAADGRKLSLKAVKPGATVLVYYEQKGGRRTVQSITLLVPEPAKEAKKKESHST